MKSKIRKMLAVDLGFLAGWALKLLGVFCVMTLGVVNWKDAFDVDISSWSAFFVACRGSWWWLALILVATLLTGFAPGDRILRMRRKSATNISRMTNWCACMERVASHVRVKDAGKTERGYELMLRAAEAELEGVLGLAENTIKTNLLLLHSADKLKVIARSKPGSPVGRVYSCDDRKLCEVAMKENRTKVHQLTRAERAKEKVPYREVAATPVVWGQQAFGAITADSVDKGVFRGKEDLVDQVLRPYATAVTVVLDLTGTRAAPYRSSQLGYWR